MASILILIILEFFLVMFLVLGYLIRFRGRIDLVAGFKEGRVQDGKGLSRVVGTSLIILGVPGRGDPGACLHLPGKGSPPVSPLCRDCCPGRGDPVGYNESTIPEKIRQQVFIVTLSLAEGS